MALTYISKLEKIPGGNDFLKEVSKTYNKDIADSISQNLRLYITLNPMPNLSFQNSGKIDNQYHYRINSQGVWKGNLRDLNLGKIVGVEADNISISASKYPSERYDPNTYLDYFLIGIPCDHKKINPESFKEGKKEGRLWLWIEYAKQTEFDF